MLRSASTVILPALVSVSSHRAATQRKILSELTHDDLETF